MSTEVAEQIAALAKEHRAVTSMFSDNSAQMKTLAEVLRPAESLARRIESVQNSMRLSDLALPRIGELFRANERMSERIAELIRPPIFAEMAKLIADATRLQTPIWDQLQKLNTPTPFERIAIFRFAELETAQLRIVSNIRPARQVLTSAVSGEVRIAGVAALAPSQPAKIRDPDVAALVGDHRARIDRLLPRLSSTVLMQVQGVREMLDTPNLNAPQFTAVALRESVRALLEDLVAPDATECASYAAARSLKPKYPTTLARFLHHKHAPNISPDYVEASTASLLALLNHCSDTVHNNGEQRTSELRALLMSVEAYIGCLLQICYG